VFFQRLTQICQVLGKPDEIIQRTLQGCASIDSLDGVNSDDNLHNKHNKDNLIELQTSNYDNQNQNHTETHPPNTCDKKDQLERGKIIDGNLSQTKSDSESGYDESCSNMSRSGIDECNSTLEADSLSHSTSLDKLNLDQLRLEIDSVAVDWRPFRNIHTCSCAIPFDHFTKKARQMFYTCLKIMNDNEKDILKLI